MELLFLEPVFKEAIWGGTKLRDSFGYDIPSDTTRRVLGRFSSATRKNVLNCDKIRRRPRYDGN